MFTIRRLKVSDRLTRSLCCTNAIESMISMARTTTRNVKRWQDAEMVRRWAAAGILNPTQLQAGEGVQRHQTLIAGLPVTRRESWSARRRRGRVGRAPHPKPLEVGCPSEPERREKRVRG